MIALLALGDVRVVNSCMIASTDLLKQTTIGILTQNFDNDVVAASSSIQDCDRSSPDFNFYGDRDTWQLETNFNINAPIKTILVNFHVFQNSTGGNNFQNTASDIAWLQQILGWANDLYEHNRQPSDPIIAVCGTSFCNACDINCRVPDTKIRFELNRIEFYQDAALNLTNNASQFQSAVINRDPNMLNQLNVYFTEGTLGNLAGFANFPSFDLNDNLYVVMLAAYNGGNSTGYYAKSRVLAHEWGHNFGLTHTYDNVCSGEFFWYDDIYGLPFPGNCPHTACYGCDAYATNGDGYTNNTMGYNQSFGFLSPKQISHIHRTLALKTTRRYVKDCPYNKFDPLVISSDELWDFDIKLYRDVVVETGATLTITCKVSLPINGRIIVKRGAKLIVDGGTITSGCPSGLWFNIEVNGNYSLPQPSLSQVLSSSYPSSPNHHGVVIIKNGAILENAQTAVSLIARDNDGNPLYQYSGSIIYAENSTFRNNKRAIAFWSYPTDNSISIVKQCTFETTRRLNDPAELPVMFISLWDIHGVSFLGNTFINTTVPGIFNDNERGKGILSIDADYTINRTCDIACIPAPACCGVRNRFEGLWYGIYATASNPFNTVSIEGCEFINTHHEIYLSGINYATITRNIFNMTGSGSPGPYGLYLNGCTGYQVEENEFFTPFENSSTYGIIINNSGNTGDEIYNNEFHDAGGGMRVQGEVSLGSNEGLQIKCNDFTSNITFYDIGIYSGDIGNPQGNCDIQTSPAGNTFSHTCHFSNTDLGAHIGTFFQYNHHDDAPRTPNCYSNVEVFANACMGLPTFTQNNACPSHLNTGDFPCYGGPIPTCEGLIIDLDQQVTALKTQYNNLVDGGNTQALVNFIQQENSPGKIKDALLAVSPYASDEALITAINKNKPLPFGVLKEIIIANSPLTTTVMDAIINRNPALPPGIMNEINAVQIGISARRELELEIAFFERQKAIAVNGLIRLFLNDTTTSNGLDSIIVVLEQEESINRKLQLTDAYIKAGRFAEARQLLDNIDTIGGFGNFCKLQNLIIDIIETGGNFDTLKSDTLLKLSIDNIAKDTLQPGFLQARAILLLVFGDIFPETIEDMFFLQQNLKTGNSGVGETETQVEQYSEYAGKKIIEEMLYEGYFLDNYPNPFSNGTIIGTYIPANFINSELVVFDIIGNVHKRFVLKKGHNFLEIKDEDFAQGIYFYSLISDGNRIETKKMVHIK